MSVMDVEMKFCKANDNTFQLFAMMGVFYIIEKCVVVFYIIARYFEGVFHCELCCLGIGCLEVHCLRQQCTFN